VNWKFCPECGGKFEAAWKFCANCGTKRDGAENILTGGSLIDLGRQMREQLGTVVPDIPWAQYQPRIVPHQRCAFEGLPPGPYNLVCFCPKCSPQCTTTSTYTVRGDEQTTYTSVMNS
jgi:hypothetical protein